MTAATEGPLDLAAVKARLAELPEPCVVCVGEEACSACRVRSDIAALVAEVERLREQENLLRAMIRGTVDAAIEIRDAGRT